MNNAKTAYQQHKCVVSGESSKEVCTDCLATEKHIRNATLDRKEYKSDAVQALSFTSKTNYISCDLQKVKMLPEIPGVKTVVFTQRIAAYNKTFSPIGKCTGLKSVAD